MYKAGTWVLTHWVQPRLCPECWGETSEDAGLCAAGRAAGAWPVLAPCVPGGECQGGLVGGCFS